jgi:hypothetical protein
MGFTAQLHHMGAQTRQRDAPFYAPEKEKAE